MWVELDVPAVLACVCDVGVAGTFSVGRIWMTLHAARCMLVIDASMLFAALLPFLDCPAYPPLSLVCVILPPIHPRRPPAVAPPSHYLSPPVRAFPRSQTDKNSLLGPLHWRHYHHPPSALCSHVMRVRIAIAGIATNTLEVLEELLGVGGMRGCGLHISGEGGREARVCGVRSPSTFSFLFLSCFLFCPRALDFARPGFGTGRSARARPRGMACALGVGLALRMQACGHNVCADSSGSARRASLGLSRCRCSGSDTYPFSPRAGRRS